MYVEDVESADTLESVDTFPAPLSNPTENQKRLEKAKVSTETAWGLSFCALSISMVSAILILHSH